MYYDFERLKKELAENLSEKRYAHVLGVESASVHLAEKYGADVKKACFAALFHDYAKCFSAEKTAAYISKYNIELNEYIKNSPNLNHGAVAAYICLNEYGIEDKDILNAVRYHTTGRENMSLLEKIICLADYIEPGRKFDGVEKLRELAEKDLDFALYTSFNGTLINLIETDKQIAPDTFSARDFLLKTLIERGFIN